MEKKSTYLIADTINGVTACDYTIFEDYPEISTMSLKSFYESLSTMEDGEINLTVYDPGTSQWNDEYFDKIDSEYGIH